MEETDVSIDQIQRSHKQKAAEIRNLYNTKYQKELNESKEYSRWDVTLDQEQSDFEL